LVSLSLSLSLSNLNSKNSALSLSLSNLNSKNSPLFLFQISIPIDFPLSLSRLSPPLCVVFYSSVFLVAMEVWQNFTLIFTEALCLRELSLTSNAEFFFHRSLVPLVKPDVECRVVFFFSLGEYRVTPKYQLTSFVRGTVCLA
jgi:hypothetical protein